MTIIAAALDPLGSAVIASDSLGSNGWSGNVYGSKLVRLRDDLVVGISGTYLLLRWLREGGATDALKEPGSAALDPLWAAWATWARAKGCGKTADDGHYLLPGWLLAVMPTSIYTLDCYGSVLQAGTPYHATGSGEQVALGALAACRMAGLGAGESAVAAVHAAIRHVPSCGGPVHVQRVGP